MAPILRKTRAISVSRTARGWGSVDRHLSHVRSVLPAGWLSIQKARVPTVQRSLRSPKWLTRLAERLLPRHADILEHVIIPFRDFREVPPLATALGPKTEKRHQLRSQPAPPKTGNRVRVEGGD